MVASFALLFIGIAVILWGAWADFMDANPIPSVAFRLESGIIFLLLSLACFVLFVWRKRKPRQL